MSPSRLDILASLLPIFHLSIGNLVPLLLASDHHRIHSSRFPTKDYPSYSAKDRHGKRRQRERERDVIFYQCGDEFSHCNLRSHQLGLPSTPSLRPGPSGLNRESLGENNESPHSLCHLT